VKVLASREDVDISTEYSLKPETVFDLMMKAWCGYHGVSLEDATFEHEGQELKPGDTPGSRGWTVDRGCMEITAHPRPVVEQLAPHPSHDCGSPTPPLWASPPRDPPRLFWLDERTHDVSPDGATPCLW